MELSTRIAYLLDVSFHQHDVEKLTDHDISFEVSAVTLSLVQIDHVAFHKSFYRNPAVQPIGEKKEKVQAVATAAGGLSGAFGHAHVKCVREAVHRCATRARAPAAAAAARPRTFTLLVIATAAAAPVVLCVDVRRLHTWPTDVADALHVHGRDATMRHHQSRRI